MSFAKEVKEEILSYNFTKIQFIYFLLGVFANNGHIYKNKNRYVLDLESSNVKFTRKVVQFFKENYNCEVDITVRQNIIKKSKTYIVNIYNIKKFLEEFNYYDFENNIIKIEGILENKDSGEIRAYFCGVFILNGSVNSPATSNYHLELGYSNKDVAIRDLKILEDYKFPFKKYTKSTKKEILYLKKSMFVSDFLKFLDASDSVINFEQVRIQRDFKNSQNRIINIETSNQLKVLMTAKKQVENITYLVQNNLFEKLPDTSKIVCLYRLDNPEASYDELSEILSKKQINISKQRLWNIFKKINDITEREKNKHG